MEFKQVRGIGYNIDDVNYLVNHLRVSWKDADPIDLNLVNFPKFREEKLGYSIPQVNAFLEVLTREVLAQNKVKIICGSGLAGWDQYLVSEKRELLSTLEGNAAAKFPVSKSENGGYSNKSVDKAFGKFASLLRNSPEQMKACNILKTKFYWSKKMNGSYDIKAVDETLARLSNYIIATTV